MFALTPFNKNSIQQKNTNNFADFNNMINDFFNSNFYSSRNLYNDTFKVDVRENEKEYLIEAEVPGIKKEKISINYADEKLIITIQSQEEVNVENEKYIHRERQLTSMERSIYLKNIDIENIKAKLEDGILKILAPKEDNPNNKYQIEIE